MHVDAYRLAGALELDDLDLDTDLDAAAVVIEWGEGVAERLADDRLIVELTRLPDDTRTARPDPGRVVLGAADPGDRCASRQSRRPSSTSSYGSR